MRRMPLPIGISDFKRVIEDRYYYVDKTLLIKELQHTNGSVVLLPRPRRFGKTLNMSMLKYFFEIREKSHAYLFHDAAIWQQPEYHALQESYPVVFLTFKSCKEASWELAYRGLTDILAAEFERHADDLIPTLGDRARSKYLSIAEGKAEYAPITSSLLFLTQLLEAKYNKRVMVFIDEYDAPIHAAYAYDYYTDMVAFMRALLTNVFKDNSNLERGVLTGILRTAKEGIFSGLNNIRVFTLLDEEFSDKFGFTNEEVDTLLTEANLKKQSAQIKEWYNGYTSGKITIYNPWSLLECISRKGFIGPYWVNTSDNEFIKTLIAQADEAVKIDLELLLEGSPVVHEIDTGLVLPGIENNQKALWSLLLFTGYLTFTNVERQEGKAVYNLALPNQEIKLLYKELITRIFETTLGSARIKRLKAALLKPDAHELEELLQAFVLKSMSTFDIPKNEPERSYHTFVLGLLVLFEDTYELKSNRKSGAGRYDIMLIPHDTKQWGIIMEFKKASGSAQESLSKAAQKALSQIKDNKYSHELLERGIFSIVAFGIGCKGKQVLVKKEELFRREPPTG